MLTQVKKTQKNTQLITEIKMGHIFIIVIESTS